MRFYFQILQEFIDEYYILLEREFSAFILIFLYVEKSFLYKQVGRK